MSVLGRVVSVLGRVGSVLGRVGSVHGRVGSVHGQFGSVWVDIIRRLYYYIDTIRRLYYYIDTIRGTRTAVHINIMYTLPGLVHFSYFTYYIYICFDSLHIRFQVQMSNISRCCGAGPLGRLYWPQTPVSSYKAKSHFKAFVLHFIPQIDPLLNFTIRPCSHSFKYVQYTFPSSLIDPFRYHH